jgi:hypothetical protein
MTRFLACLLTLLFSLGGPALGRYSEVGRSIFASKGMTKDQWALMK